ncbi:HU family DNA-binding protein [Nonomuraea sp. K274]|uniref:HU family DNA-binding protein n=1 Tax=Nonomuraea cypriaca TaxID=1187855 RepID=A0A931AM85_9ACTN|nr:HU family DNA-binding protein [Nonomuraea cypriaca]MBF8194400.1 HU family DNA-binding protein [Nonomuraea cypriaca]
MDTKKELVAALALDPRVPSKAAAEAVIDALGDLVEKSLAAAEPVRLHKIGVISTYMAKARAARNPRTGDPIDVPARPAISFRASDALKARIRDTPGAVA